MKLRTFAFNLKKVYNEIDLRKKKNQKGEKV